MSEELNLKYPVIQIKPLLDLIALNSHFIEPGHRPTPVCDDPDDKIFLAAAMAGKAQYIVTGHKALLRVETYPHGRILGVREFVSLCK